MTPGGSCTSTLTVPASERSVGTRMSSRAKPPAGPLEGCTVTWADAEGAAPAPAPRRPSGRSWAWGAPSSSDRDLEAGAELVEVRDARNDLQAPVTRRGQRGTRHDVVPGTGFRSLQIDRLDAALGQRGLDPQLLRRVVLAAVAAVEQVEMHLVRSRPCGVDGQLHARGAHDRRPGERARLLRARRGVAGECPRGGERGDAESHLRPQQAAQQDPRAAGA